MTEHHPVKSTVVLTAVLVIAAGLLVWGRTGPGDVTAPIAVAPDVAEFEEIETDALAGKLTEPSQEPSRRQVMEVERTMIASSPAPQTSFLLSGTLVVRDEFDVERSKTNGTFALWTSEGTRQVPVVDGAWQLKLAPDQQINFRVHHTVEMTTDRRVGELTGGYEPFTEETALTEDTELALTAEWLARHQLVVLDAETREHLDQLLVVERFPLLNRFVHPGPIDEEDVIYRYAYSPLSIDPRERFGNLYFIGREGYRWSTIELDHKKGGRHEVLLQPGAGDLEIGFRGHPGRTQVRIHVASNEFREMDLRTDNRESLLLAGLAPGRYVIEARGTRRSGIVRKEVEVAAGPNEVVLDVPRVYEDPPPISGTVAFQRAEESQLSRISFRRSFRPSLLKYDVVGQRTLPTDYVNVPVAEMKRVAGGWQFDAVQLGVGNYEVSVWGPKSKIWSKGIEIGPGGSGPLRIEVPTFREARIRLLDATTGAAITAATTNVKFDLGAGVTIAYDDQSQLWYARARRSGSVRGKVTTNTNLSATVDIQLRQRPAQIDVRLQPK